MEVNRKDRVFGMLRALFILIVSIGLIVIGYAVADGSDNTVPVILFVVGVIGFIIGTLVGIGTLAPEEEEHK